MNKEVRTHSQKLEAYRLQCENIGQDLLATGMKALHIVSDRLENLDPESISLSDLGSLSRVAGSALHIGDRLLSESLAVQKLLETLE